MPIYKSTAEFVKTKLVTIPSCEHVNRYAVETEGIVEEKVFYNHENNSEKSETKNDKDTKKEEEDSTNSCRNSAENRRNRKETTCRGVNRTHCRVAGNVCQYFGGQKEDEGCSVFDSRHNHVRGKQSYCVNLNRINLVRIIRHQCIRHH